MSEENKKIKSKNRRKLSTNVIIVIIGFIVLTCISVSYNGYVLFQKNMIKKNEEKIGGIMNMVLDEIDVSDLEKVINTKTETEEFKNLCAHMDVLKVNFNMEHIVIVVPVKDGEDYDVIFIASGLNPDERETGQGRKDIELPKFGDSIKYAYPDGFISNIYEEMYTLQDIRYSTATTEYGTTFDGLVPIINGKGEPIALLTAGISASDITLNSRRYVLYSVINFLIFSAIFISLFVIWIEKRVIIPIKKLEGAMKSFDEKSQNKLDPSTMVIEDPGIHSNDELESLSDSMVSVSIKMREYAEDMINSMAQTGDLKDQIAKINKMALNDSLTGVKNKLSFEDALERLNQSIESGDAEFGIIKINLNNLGDINRQFGHDKGDIYIKNMCRIFCDTFTHSPVYRIDGDEFVVILENRDYKNSDKLLNNVKTKINYMSFNKSLEEWEKVSAASGLAVFEKENDKSAEDVYNRANELMKFNKADMKNVRCNYLTRT